MFKNKKVLVLTPHLSTGGSPQYLLDFLKTFKDGFSDLLVVEHSNFSDEFVIQKNKLKELIGKDNLITLGYHGEKESVYVEKRKKLIDIINEFKPEIIWMNEFPECYDYKLPPDEVMDFIYQKERKYKIIETTHYNAFNFDSKRFIPDEFIFCSPIHMEKSKNIDLPKVVWEVPIENKKRPNREQTLKSLGLDPYKVHVLNVGLFHQNKNQKYIFEIAKQLKNVEFHFIGNTCFLNDCGIGEDINLPNCNVWGERSDVDKFMSCMDIYLFPSHRELNPLTVKEALSWGMDVVVNRDENYTHQYEDLENFHIIDEIDILSHIKSKDLYGKFLIVCSFYNNTKEHVEQTFKNVLGQTYQNWILVVGDDFSDDTEFRQYLKNKVIEINDKRILYYNVKHKRELYLYQNFFKEIRYDYYFDLDSDDIIDNKILETYNKYFVKYPEVVSIFSNSRETNDKIQLQKYHIIQPPKDYVEEFTYRDNKDTNLLWVNRSSYGMYGHARCMRRPEDSKMKIIDNIKTSTDTLFLFYNLNRGKHLHIPRNLFTHVKRKNSDSGMMTDDEYKNFNLNANYHINRYEKNEKTGNLNLFEDVWYETSALSTCEFINYVDEITIISKITDENKKLIDELYFDKKITYNNPEGKNLIIVYNNIPKNFEWDKINAKNVTIYHYNDDYSYDESVMFDKFNEVNNQVVDEINKKIIGFTWFNFFRHLVITKKENISKDIINVTYRNGVKVEILGDKDKEYDVKFINDETNELIYQTTLKTNMWTTPTIKYFIKWRVEVWLKGELIKKDILNLENKNVLIKFDSKSLGDSIAWVPYVEEFRKKHNCKISCATFKNFLYDKSYTDIDFVDVGQDENKYDAVYSIGWYFDKKINPNDVRTIPLQQTASDILGLKFKEIRTKITHKILERPIKEKYVSLSIHSTSQCKYWNKIGGWEKIVSYLNDKGYKVICVDQYPVFGDGKTMNIIPTNALNYTGKSFEDFINNIYHSEFHMGIGSGDAWLAWGLGKKVLMVSSFSEPFCEFIEDNYRVYNNKETDGYFNKIEYRFDASNWNWNPFKEMYTLNDWNDFETIEVKDVIEKLNELIII